MKDALTTGEVAKYCGVNFRTVIRWIEKGYMQAYKLPGRGDNRVPVESLREFMVKNNMPIPEELREAQPADSADGNSVASEENAQKNDASTAANKVLVVEDEELMAKSIIRTLKRKGYEVAHAANGIEAGILLERFWPAALTLDLQMPGMSGYEVLEVLKSDERYAHIKVLVVSAASKVKMLEVMDLGVDGILEKPFKSDELLEAMSKIAELSS